MSIPRNLSILADAFDGTNLSLSGTATATKLIPTGTSVTGNGMYLPATNSIGFSTNGTNAVYIDASQNVGIGTSSPGDKLGVVGYVSARGATTADTSIVWAQVSDFYSLPSYTGAGLVAKGSTATGTTAGIANANQVGMLFQNSNNVLFNSNNLINYVFSINGTERMRIDTTGTAGFNVIPATWWNSANAKQIQFGANSAIWSYSAATNSQTRLYSNAYLNASVLDTYLNTNAASYYNQYGGEHIWVNAPSGTAGTTVTFTERMRIDINGNLLVNASSPATNCQNTIVGASTGINLALGVIHNATTNSVRGILTKCPNFNGNDGYLMIGARSGGDVAYMFTNGNWTNLNNSYGAISDIKIKENIADATPKLEKINQVRVVTYNLKSDPSQKQIGVIAQELEQVFPSMVEETADRDAEGNELDTKTKYVKYSVFVPILIKSIQEQQALITTLTARIEALETK